MGSPGPCIHNCPLVAFGMRSALRVMKAYSGDLGCCFGVVGVFVVCVICLGPDTFYGFFRSRVGMWSGVCETVLVRPSFSTWTQ